MILTNAITIPHHNHRPAFSMITAIVTIVIMVSLTALIMGITGKTVHETTAQYQKEQAALLARSYTEQALLYAIHYDRIGNGNCLESIDSQFGNSGNLYEITTNIQYIGNKTLLPAGCNAVSLERWDTNTSSGFDATISLMVDVFVKYKILDHPLNLDSDASNDIYQTFHRRTVQKL